MLGGWVVKLKELQGECRYYVNDFGVTLSGSLDYGYGENITVDRYVGIVDEHEGGMFAFGPSESMERLADKLNKLHLIEGLMRA